MDVNKTRINNKGFTLVEIVVVVVILVVLATMLIPTLSKYFYKSYKEKVMEQMDDILKSSQAKLYDLYAQGSHNNEYSNVIEGNSTASGEYKDSDIKKLDFSKEVLSMVNMNIREDSPSVVIIGVGRYDIYADPNSLYYDPEKAYTVYSLVYQPNFNGKVFFYNDYNEKNNYLKNNIVQGEVKPDGITKIKTNILKSDDGDDIYIQYYYIKSGKGNDRTVDQIWSHINSQVRTYNK